MVVQAETALVVVVSDCIVTIHMNVHAVHTACNALGGWPLAILECGICYVCLLV